MTDPVSYPDDTTRARVEALHRYGILDTPPEPHFDDAVALVKSLCAVPIALISLVDEHRQWFKAQMGVDIAQTPLDTSVCALAIRQDGVFVVPDLSLDPRTATMSLVTAEGGIRFYAGAPLVTSDGIAIGSLCVIDTVPRPAGLDPQQARALEAIARQVTAQIELRGAIDVRDRAIVDQVRSQAEAAADSTILETLLRAQQAVTDSGGDFEASLNALVTAALAAVQPADGVVVEMRDGDEMVYHAAAGTSSGDLGQRVSLTGSLSGTAFTERRTLLTADALADPRADQALVRRLNMRSMLVAPLVRQGTPFGVLKIHARSPHVFSSRHVLIAQLIAGLIATLFTENDASAMRRSAEAADLRYNNIIDSAVDSAIISTDEDGLVTSWSKGAEEIFGWTEEEILDRPIALIYTPEDRAIGRAAEERREAKQEGHARDERWHLRKDGSRFFAHGAVTPLEGTENGFVKSLRNITEEHANKNALALSRERLELATRAADLGSYDYHLPSGELLWDDRCRALFGVSPGAPVSYDGTFLPALHPDDRAATEAAVATALEPDGARTFDIVFRTVGIEDGIERTIAARGAAYFEDRDPVRLIGMVRDITAERREQAALRETADRLRLASRATNDVVWDWDLRRDEVLWNEAIGTALGYAGDAVGGDGAWWIEHIHPDDRARIDTSIHAAIDGDAADWSDEYRFRRADGSYADIRDRGFLLRDERGAAIRMIGAMLDQTRRKQIERDLRRAKQGLEQEVEERTLERDQIWQATPDLLSVITLDGRFVEINPAWSATLGWSDAELMAHPAFDLVHPDDLPATRAGMARLAAGDNVFGLVNRFRTADGDHRWLNWNAVAREGKVYSVVRDVTAEHRQGEALARAEEQLRQAQKMEAVGQLTGGLAHDFNNLLAGISGSLEMMQLRVAQGRSGELDRYLGAAQGAAKRAAALTHRLLAFSRRQTLSPTATDLNQLAAGMEDLIRRTAGPQIALETVAAGGLWRTLVDPNQLENALLNLCINARDAMPDGGTLTVETANRWLDDRAAAERGLPPGQYVSLCVSDTGTGMAKDVIDRAFDPFFTTKPIGQGTGLGLSMIYGFARQSDGQARIYSEVGQGTMVCLYLPRHRGDDVRDPLPLDRPVAPRAEEGETVLVVDDEPTVRMLVVDALEEMGYRAIEAGDGPAGLAILQSDQRIDLLVTDVGLPGGMNGRQLADAARVKRGELKVLFITGYAENAVLSHGHLSHGMHVLTKPFAIDALGTKIRSIIER